MIEMIFMITSTNSASMEMVFILKMTAIDNVQTATTRDNMHEVLVTITTKTNKSLQNITVHHNKIKKEITSTIAEIKKQTLDTKNDCNDKLKKMKQDMDDTV